MILNIILAVVITLIFYIKSRLNFKLKILFHPIVLTPILGLIFGEEGFSTGVTVGVIVELIWGSKLIGYKLGLKYSLLLSLLTVSLISLTGNISLFFNLSLILILVFAFQESFSWAEEKSYFIGIVFIFNMIMLSSNYLIKELLGLIPAQFLNDLAVSGGALIPIVGLSMFLIQAIQFTIKEDGIWYYSYVISVVVTSVLLLNSFYWAILLFPISCYLLYYLFKLIETSSLRYCLRNIVIILVILTVPMIVEWNSPLIEGEIEYFLWIEVILTLYAILMSKLTAIEGYFIMILIGIISSKLGLFI
ncbi:hypothetical protein [Orenia marismortui]|uniref:PTS system mannose-specific IIC component n=1 Tax=Orenia marismortui TaxID=46469 RepID=A0A4R8GHY4_9FIRM|nr:hypothetical protein [Orenia marismortui]TDX45280.1 PTS system mannose-specific IIC component [Orenia marismortui]